MFWYRYSLCNGLCSHTEKYSYLTEMIQICGFKVLGEDTNIKKKKTSLLQLAIYYCTHQCRLQQYYCSDAKGRDTKVQYQLMIYVLQLLFVHAFPGCNTTSRFFDVELVRRQYSKFLSKKIQYYRHVQRVYNTISFRSYIPLKALGRKAMIILFG